MSRRCRLGSVTSPDHGPSPTALPRSRSTPAHSARPWLRRPITEPQLPGHRLDLKEPMGRDWNLGPMLPSSRTGSVLCWR